jgi:hypothetical protein
MGSSPIRISKKKLCTVLDELQSPVRTVEIERFGHVIRRDEGGLVRDIME